MGKQNCACSERKGSRLSVFYENAEQNWSWNLVWEHAATEKTTAASTDNRNATSHSNFGSKSEDACWQQQQQQKWWQHRRGRQLIAEDVSNNNYAIKSKVTSREPATAISPAGLGTPATAGNHATADATAMCPGIDDTQDWGCHHSWRLFYWIDGFSAVLWQFIEIFVKFRIYRCHPVLLKDSL